MPTCSFLSLSRSLIPQKYSFTVGHWSRLAPDTTLAREDVPWTFRLPQLLNLLFHAQTFILKLHNPQPHVVVVILLFLIAVFVNCSTAVLLEHKVTTMRSLRVLHVVRDKEPARDRGSQAELFEEKNLNYDSEREPFVLSCMRAGFQGKLLAIHESAELLFFWFCEPWMWLNRNPYKG